jgi:hypothetical protein
MRLRFATFAFAAAVVVALSAGAGEASAQPKTVVEPKLPALGKEPAVTELRRFLRSLRARDHASKGAFRRLVRGRHRLGSAARKALKARDHRRKSFLRKYLAKSGRRHRGRVAKRSSDYYAYLRSLESHQVRRFMVRISDEIDRLAYS